MAADFAANADEMHRRIDGKRMLVIGGAGTIGSNYVKAALRDLKLAAMYVVDIDENQLTELTRELRAAGGPVTRGGVTERTVERAITYQRST